MIFAWIDRHGQQHSLTAPEPLIDEIEEVASEIDQLVSLFDNPDVAMRDTGRQAIGPLQARLDQLNADVERWNAYADSETYKAAAELVDRIEELPGAIVNVMIVVTLHDEHDVLTAGTAGNLEAKAKALASPMTPVQRQAIAASRSRTPPPDNATRAKAKAWLDGQPLFARQCSDTGGWFAWTDRNGHAHRLVDALPIERELVGIAGELAILKPELVQFANADALFRTVRTGVAFWERLQILQYDLERFEREAEARDLAACKQFAADWRSKRKTT